MGDLNNLLGILDKMMAIEMRQNNSLHHASGVLDDRANTPQRRS